MTTPWTLYHSLLDAWNRRDAAGYASLFLEAGSVVGFDGSELRGKEEIDATLGLIFADHETAAYVGKVRDEVAIADNVVLLRAVCGMVPPGHDDLNPAVNAVQALLAVRTGDDWRIAHFQNTPAQYHGRPELAEALTAELKQLL